MLIGGTDYTRGFSRNDGVNLRYRVSGWRHGLQIRAIGIANPRHRG